MTGSTTFHLVLCFTDLAKRVARITSESVDLPTIPPKYHKFTDVFSKAKVETLAPTTYITYKSNWKIGVIITLLLVLLVVSLMSRSWPSQLSRKEILFFVLYNVSNVNDNHCYNSKTLELVNKRTLYRDYTRKLNGVPSTNLSILYILSY